MQHHRLHDASLLAVRAGGLGDPTAFAAIRRTHVILGRNAEQTGRGQRSSGLRVVTRNLARHPRPGDTGTQQARVEGGAGAHLRGWGREGLGDGEVGHEVGEEAAAEVGEGEGGLRRLVSRSSLR